jgi:hypothetical protein
MRTPLRWIVGGAAIAGALTYRFLRRRRVAEPARVEDPRAEQLRQRLEESRTLVQERDDFESAETPVDRAEATGAGLEERRRRVHEHGRAAADRMRGPDT